MCGPRRRTARSFRSAFGIEDLLWLLAVLILLALILLPSRSRAKEQARITTCLAHMRTVGQAANAYLLEFDDLPWALPSPHQVRGERYTWDRQSEFIWGGGRPDRSMADWQTAGGSAPGPKNSDVWRLPPRHRPLNVYI